MIKCKICGHTTKYRLIEHIQRTHKIPLEDYKVKYGEYVSEEYKVKVSEQEKKKWKNDKYKKRMTEVRKGQFTKEVRKKISQTQKELYKNGKQVWNTGLTKETDDRLRNVGEINSKRLKGKKNPEHSLRMKEFFRKNPHKIHNCYKLSAKDREKWRINISKTLSKKIANGDINTLSNFNHGYYNGAWYASTLELEAMKLFDEYNIKWTNKHGIRIDYIGLDGLLHKYIPDFLVGDEYVIEMKGWDRGDLKNKIEAATAIYKEKYIICFTIEELKEKLNETYKDKIN